MAKSNSIIVTTLANILEWVDYALYGGFVFIIAQNFFPSNDEYTNTIYAYLIFALGFISRPIGGALFGHISDNIGREKSLSLSIILMVIPTVLIGLLPNYASIGMIAPITLIVCRFLQGIAIGGEYTGAMVHMVEEAEPHKRGIAGSFAEMGCLAGMLIGGSLCVSLLELIIGHAAVVNWAWRIPFVLSALIIIVAFKIQKPERSAESKGWPDKAAPIVELIKKYKKLCAYAAMASAFSGVNFYTILVFIPNYLAQHTQITVVQAFSWASVISAVMIIFCFVGGYLSDRFNRKKVIIPSIIAMIGFAYPMMSNIGTTSGFVYQLCAGICLAIYFGGRPAFFAEAFPKTLRCTAVSMCLSISHAIFAGTTSALATYMTKVFGDVSYFSVYLILISLMAILGFSMIKDRTGEDLE